MKKVLEALKAKEDFCSIGFADEKDIVNAEKHLGLKFSKDYKACLKAFGIFSINAHEITGICNSTRLNVVDVTLQEKSLCKVSKGWYVIEQANMDGIVVWQDENGFVYQSQPNKEPVKIANSLLEYLEC